MVIRQRAIQAEDKQERHQAILDAAERLLLRSPERIASTKCSRLRRAQPKFWNPRLMKNNRNRQVILKSLPGLLGTPKW